MIPDPLHPAIVHFPIVLCVLLPIFALGALWAMRRGAAPRRAWLVPVAGAVALALSAWMAVLTGESTADRVERVVPAAVLDEHEEAGEMFLWLSAGLVLVTAAGLVRGRTGSIARVVATVGAVGLVAAAYQVGHDGGALVYKHGAASAYAPATPGAPQSSAHEEHSDAER